MKLSTLKALLAGGRLRLLFDVQRLLGPTYRLAFLSTAATEGLLARLRGGPIPAQQLLAELAPDPAVREGLAAWLAVGVRLGELSLDERGYGVRGRLARRLAEADHDAVAALVEEAASLHYGLLRELPARAREARPMTLADQDGRLIARSSRVLEPILGEVVDDVVPAGAPVRLLEIGCGSGVYIRRAAARNPQLTALGLELQPEVAEAARENLLAWGLEPRATVEAGDVRRRAAEPAFDLATLHNNIYYFPVAERVSLLRHVRGFLRPGGRLLVTTGCQGGSPVMELLNLWAASTAGCGPLPAADELVAQMKEAGFAEARAKRLVPGESFFAFVGSR
jgi:4-hydroxy-2,2'-bipyrrole-5-carbaldehyde O-methyltransferase